jgi:hypothetical protein
MKEKMKLREENDSWMLSIKGREVTRCLVDYAFSIELWIPDDPISIRINRPFLFKTRDQTYKISPAEEPIRLGPVLSIVHKTIQAVIAHKDGSLSVEISDEIKLDVSADVHYEAWEINGREGMRIVSLPGGGLSIWSAKK